MDDEAGSLEGVRSPVKTRLTKKEILVYKNHLKTTLKVTMYGNQKNIRATDCTTCDTTQTKHITSLSGHDADVQSRPANSR